MATAKEANLSAQDTGTFIAECLRLYTDSVTPVTESEDEYAGMTPEQATETFFARYVG